MLFTDKQLMKNTKVELLLGIMKNNFILCIKRHWIDLTLKKGFSYDKAQK